MKQKKQYSFKKLLKYLLLVLLFIFSILIVSFFADYYNTNISLKHNFFQKGDILATSTGPKLVSVDFSKQIATGSPLIFGGIIAPEFHQQDTWNKLQEVGVTVIKENIFIENEVPQNITLEDYRNNVNDIQNPEKWNINSINLKNTNYKNARDRGMKTMAIFSYAPPWLTHSGTKYGIPKDWNVFEDIIKKTYKLHKDYIDFIEVWNEPTLIEFLDTTGSGLTRQEAYVQIYYHAQTAIREAEKELKDNRRIPIGGPVGHDPIDTSIPKALLENPRTKDAIDFVSYHNYEKLPEPSWDNYKNILKGYGKENIPIYLTEWNYKGSNEKNLFYRSGDGAIIYTADKFVEFLKMGLKIANYYALVDINRPKYENDDPSYGFYKWENNSAQLLPQAKTWRLMSKTLGLGKGESRIFDAGSENESIKSIGFTNSNNDTGVILINKSDSDTYVTVNFKNLNSNNIRVPFYVYIASVKYSGSETADRFYLPENSEKKYQVTLLVPAQSAEALLVPQNYDWKDTLRSYLP